MQLQTCLYIFLASKQSNLMKPYALHNQPANLLMGNGAREQKPKK